MQPAGQFAWGENKDDQPHTKAPPGLIPDSSKTPLLSFPAARNRNAADAPQLGRRLSFSNFWRLSSYFTAMIFFFFVKTNNHYLCLCPALLQKRRKIAVIIP